MRAVESQGWLEGQRDRQGLFRISALWGINEEPWEKASPSLELSFLFHKMSE